MVFKGRKPGAQSRHESAGFDGSRRFIAVCLEGQRPAVMVTTVLPEPAGSVTTPGLPMVTDVGHLVPRSVTRWPPEPLSTYPRAQVVRELAPGRRNREGLKPEGVETWNKARCVARKPVPGTAGTSMVI